MSLLGNDVIVAPFFNREHVRRFTESLEQACGSVEFMEASDFWRHVFPDRDFDADVRLSEFGNLDAHQRAQQQNVHFVVVLTRRGHTEEGDMNNPFYGRWEKKDHMSVSLIDLRGETPHALALAADASGVDTALWPGYYFFVLVVTSDSEDAVVDALAGAVAGTVSRINGGVIPRLVVVAASDESYGDLP
jgi:hypothetical protein